MPNYNRVILMGNITRDPELRYIPSGTAVTELGLAVNDRRKGPNGEWIEEVQFIDVTFWGRTAEIACEHLSKGRPIFVEGKLKLDRWEKDGQKHSKLRVIGDRLEFLGSKEGGGSRGSGGGGGGNYSSSGDEPQYSSAPAAGRQQAPPPADDDLPF